MYDIYERDTTNGYEWDVPFITAPFIEIWLTVINLLSLQVKMQPKKWIRVDTKKIEKAGNEVLQDDISMTLTAQIYNVSKSHLHR